MNVLVIVADSLRADRLHCCGNPNENSPIIDQLSKEGVLFTNVIATANHTLPCLVSAFTGLYPVSHGISTQEAFNQWAAMWDTRRTPFRVLQENGYVVAGDDPNLYSPLGFDVDGRDVHRFLEKNSDAAFCVWHRSEETHLPYNPPPPFDKAFLPKDFDISPSLQQRLDVVKTHLIVHRPGLISKLEAGAAEAMQREGYKRTAGTATFEKSERPAIVSLYDGAVKMFDNEVGEYLGRLKELGILEDTMVAITSDHGEQLLERGAIGHSSCSLEGNLCDENIRIPLILWHPFALPKGRTVNTQVSQVDIMPTLFEILGFEMPGSPDGRSLCALIESPETPWPEEAYAETQPCGWQSLDDDDRMIWCIRKPPHKLTKTLGSDGIHSYELFDLNNDPGEERNIVNDHPQIRSALKERLEAWIARQMCWQQ